MTNYIFKFIPGKGKVWYRPFIRHWGIILKAASVAIFLVVLKFFIEYYHLSFMPADRIITSFMGGVFFTISILFAGAMADFKESEKIPGEMAVSIKTMYKDASIIPIKDKSLTKDMQVHILGLLSVINSNLRRNVWKLKEIDSAIDLIDDDLVKLSNAGVTPNYVLKIRAELSNVDKLSHRADVITETTFIPAAYTLAKTAIFSLVFMLLFAVADNITASLITLGAVSLVLISLVLLIQDMDSPFQVDSESYADVDLSILFNLEEHLKKITVKSVKK